jgi:hypothetical protein
MVQIIENWADVEGVVVGTRPNPELAQFVAVQLTVDRVVPVNGFPNLFSAMSGQTLDVNVPQQLANLADLAPGRHVRVRVRKGGPGAAFAHPEHVQVLGAG